MKIAACLVVGLSVTGITLADDRGVVMQSQFGLSGAFVVDATAQSFVGELSLVGSTTNCAITPDGSLAFSTDFLHTLWVLYLPSTPPALAGAPNPIPITPRGWDAAVTPDGRFVVVCGDYASNLLSVVDVDYRVETGTFDLGGECDGIDICRDGSVLVSSNAGMVRRLTIDAVGQLSDTGEGFPISAAGSVHCAPDGRSGVTFDNIPGKLISFRTKGMTPVSERWLPSFGVAGSMAPDGTKFFARTFDGTIQAYAYDPSTAVLGETPIFSRQAGAGGAKGLAIDPSGSTLYVPQYFALSLLDPATGDDVGAVVNAEMLYPSGICFRPLGAEPCAPGDACEDGNSCTDDACDAGTGTCTHTANDGNACSDGNACTLQDRCAFGLCVPQSAVDCGAGSGCSAAVCDPATGTCHDAPIDCDDHNPCTDDACDPVLGCTHAPSPYFSYCDDRNVCDGNEYCDGYGSCISSYPPQCDDFVVCTVDGCDPLIGCTNFPAPVGTSCDPDGNPCDGTAACDANLTCVPGPPVACDDGNPCTSDACDPVYGCVHTPEPAYTDCDNGNFCDGHDYCDGFGYCLSSGYPCYPTGNPCTISVCDPVTACGEQPAPAGFPCEDGNACNGAETCNGAGSCIGSSPVICAPVDPCHVAGSCDPGSGFCSNPAAPDGTPCDDGNPGTQNDACRAGACTGGAGCTSTGDPKTWGWYHSLCTSGGHSGDAITDADAACVAANTSAFAGITTSAEICEILSPSHHGNDPAGKLEKQLMTLALNVCRQRVCPAQGLDATCSPAATVGQAFHAANATWVNPGHTDHELAVAECQAAEINNGHALRLDTLAVKLEGFAVRLTWIAPTLDDGTGTPTGYDVWRRPLGSLAPFTKIGTTTDPTALDTTAAQGAFEYEVTVRPR